MNGREKVRENQIAAGKKDDAPFYNYPVAYHQR
jgi:hypothetical protein